METRQIYAITCFTNNDKK